MLSLTKHYLGIALTFLGLLKDLAAWARSSELVSYHTITWCHNPEDHLNSSKNLKSCILYYEGPLKSLWTYVITPTRNFVEVRWRSLFRSTSLGKRCTSYNALPTSRKSAEDRLPQNSGGWWNRRFWPFTFVSPSLKRFHHLITAARLIASSPCRVSEFSRATLLLRHPKNDYFKP
jgi:hypothetical protein